MRRQISQGNRGGKRSADDEHGAERLSQVADAAGERRASGGSRPQPSERRKDLRVTTTNSEFEFMGINHLAPTCRDMKETVDFYSGVLGMPLICTTAAGPTDQVFFFDVGNGTCLAFMWSPDYPPAAPGVASPAQFLEDSSLLARVDCNSG